MLRRRPLVLLKSALLLRPLLAVSRGGSSVSSASSASRTCDTASTTTAGGIPPFHYAFPVHDLGAAKAFYGEVMGCSEGRSSVHWQDYNLYGHQIVCHFVGEGYRCKDYINPVDNMEVPVPHAGIVLTEEQFLELADRLRKANINFVIEPQKRFIGAPGEQWTMFFKDQSGNNLEFKAMAHPGNLFAKYNVPEG